LGGSLAIAGHGAKHLESRLCRGELSMTAKEAVDVGVRFTQLNVRNIYVFILLSLVFGGWTVLSADINETEAYADVRKVMAIGYVLLAVSTLLLSLHFTSRASAAFKLGGGIADPSGARTKGVFRGVSVLWVLFPMVAIIIIVTYIVLIYAVDGGLF